MAQDGLARAVRPAHTMYDGDTIFALSTGGMQADVNLIGAFAAEVFAEAIVRGVKGGAGLMSCAVVRDLIRFRRYC
jgi:L-aminopeptidase/D-esterase-like protein